MKKIFYISLFFLMFVLCEIKTNAKFLTIEFVPNGYNYIDPNNFYYTSVTSDRHGYIKSNRMFNVSNIDEFVFGIVQIDTIEILSFEYCVYNVQYGEIENVIVEVDDPNQVYFENYDEDCYYMTINVEVMIIDESVKLYDMSNYYLIDSNYNVEELTEEDLLYQGANLGELMILDDEITIETSISNPISYEEISNNLYVYDYTDELLLTKNEIINTYVGNENKIGEYLIEYEVTNSLNLTTNLKVNIKVVDDIPPEFEGITEFIMYNIDLKTLADIQEKLSVIDNVDGDISDTIEILEENFTTRTEELGTFYVLFNASDDAGNNTEHRVDIKIIQGDFTKPYFEGVFEHVVYTDDPKDEEYFLSFITAKDDYTEDINERVEVIYNDYQYNTDKMGEYKLIIKVVDNAKNFKVQNIIIKVYDKSYPVFVLGAIDVTIPLKTNMGSVYDIISYLHKTNHLASTDVSVVSDEYTANKNVPGSYKITLEQNNKMINVYVNVEEEIAYQNRIPSITSNDKITMLDMVYKKVSKVWDFIKKFISSLFS